MANEIKRAQLLVDKLDGEKIYALRTSIAEDALREAEARGMERVLNLCRGMEAWNGYVPEGTDMAAWLESKLASPAKATTKPSAT